MEENIVITKNPKNYSGSVIPATKDSVVVTDNSGKFSSKQTLPTKVQNNIDVEKISFSDKTINDATTTAHGLLPKLNGLATYFLNGLGQWAVPPRPTKSDYFGNIWWVKAGTTVTIDDDRENVVTTMQIYGSLQVYGKLTLL